MISPARGISACRRLQFLRAPTDPREENNRKYYFREEENHAHAEKSWTEIYAPVHPLMPIERFEEKEYTQWNQWGNLSNYPNHSPRQISTFNRFTFGKQICLYIFNFIISSFNIVTPACTNINIIVESIAFERHNIRRTRVIVFLEDRNLFSSVFLFLHNETTIDSIRNNLSLTTS